MSAFSRMWVEEGKDSGEGARVRAMVMWEVCTTQINSVPVVEDFVTQFLKSAFTQRGLSVLCCAAQTF